MPIEPTDRLTFWRGWYDGARRYPDAQRLAVYDAILAFAFDGVEPAEPEGDLTAAIVFQTIATIRPTIEISRKRREFGAAGGRSSKGEAEPKPTASKAEAKRKQSRSKTEAKPKQPRKTRKQVKEQVQEQDKEQEHIANSCSRDPARKKPPSLDQFLAGATLAGVPEDYARTFYTNLVGVGWLDADGLYVTNWRRYLRKSYFDDVKKISAARESSSDGLDAYKIGR